MQVWCKMLDLLTQESSLMISQIITSEKIIEKVMRKIVSLAWIEVFNTLCPNEYSSIQKDFLYNEDKWE